MKPVKLTTSDIDLFTKLVQVFEDVFEMKQLQLPPTGHLQRLLDKDDFHVFVVLIGNEVVGGLTAYTLHQYYSTKPLAYIFDLAVQRQRQRQGIGTLLTGHVKNYFRELGYEEVFVQADRADAFAVEFYRRTNPTAEEDVFHYYYTL